MGFLQTSSLPLQNFHVWKIVRRFSSTCFSKATPFSLIQNGVRCHHNISTSWIFLFIAVLQHTFLLLAQLQRDDVFCRLLSAKLARLLLVSSKVFRTLNFFKFCFGSHILTSHDAILLVCGCFHGLCASEFRCFHCDFLP